MIGKSKGVALVAVLAAAALIGGAAAAPTKPKGQDRQCFRSADWRGWKATPDGHSVYIEAGLNRVWRLDMNQPCTELNRIDAVMVTRTRNSWICDPLDFNIRVAQRGVGVTRFCRVDKMTRLSAEEVAALPKTLRP